MKITIAAWLIAIAVLGVHGTSVARPRCESERERAAHTVRKILDEWPIRERDYLTDYVGGVARRIINKGGLGGEQWRIYVVRNLSANGFSIGDGYIFVNEGALLQAKNESQLAAVLAHEIAHEAAGHFCEPEIQRPSRDWNLFSNDEDRLGIREKSNKLGSIHQMVDPGKELEADRRALDLLSIAGYDPRAMLQVARRVAAEYDEANSGLGQRRVAALERLLARTPEKQVANSDEFFRMKDQLEQALN